MSNLVPKKYVALISQSSTTAPTEDAVLENSIGEIVFAYTSQGVYTLTLAGAFTSAKTIATCKAIVGHNASIVRTSANVLTLTVKTIADTGGAVANAGLTASPIEILVYA